MGTGIRTTFGDGGAVALHRPGRTAALRSAAVHALGGAAWAAALLLVAAAVLLAVGPRMHLFQVNWVQSGSMAPTIPVGSLTVLTPVRIADLRSEDVIAFQRPGDRRLVTHRIVAIDSDADGLLFTTKGDANGVPDPGPMHLTGTGWRYAFSVPGAGYVVGLAHAGLARSLLISVPVVLLALLLIADVVRPKRSPSPRT